MEHTESIRYNATVHKDLSEKEIMYVPITTAIGKPPYVHRYIHISIYFPTSHVSVHVHAYMSPQVKTHLEPDNVLKKFQ